MPCYVQGIGKMTKVSYKKGGDELITYSINKVISDYCALNLKSLKIIKDLGKKITGRKILFPLYVKKSDIFIPIKTIKPFNKGDNCTGYVNIRYIKEIDFTNNIIKLINGQYINYLENMETIKKRIADCAILDKTVIAGEYDNY